MHLNGELGLIELLSVLFNVDVGGLEMSGSVFASRTIASSVLYCFKMHGKIMSAMYIDYNNKLL